MIVRKPYAFLIKYFKIIHIILFVLMTYMVFKVRTIYLFFANYIKTGTYNYFTDMASQYVSIFMIITTILLVTFLLLIYFLMKQKKKPVFYYLISTIFYTITFIFLLYLMSFYTNLEFQTYSNQALVILRDLTMVLYYLNYLFLIVAFTRGFGFNIKKFNFEKDLKELDITEADREEIELGVSIDYEKVSHFLRKRKRHFKYYLKENSYILIIFLVIVTLFTSAYLVVDNLVINKTYHEMDVITLNNLQYTINNSYLTNKDQTGKIIKDENTYYLIVNFSVLNKSLENKSLSISNSRIKIKNKYYYPVTSISSIFSDFGEFYKKQVINVDTKSTYIMVFEIDYKPSSKITLELYNSKRVNKGEATLYYKDVVLSPYVYKEKSLGEYKLTEKVSLDKTYLNTGSFSINSYEILEIVDYTYTKCDNDVLDGKCLDYKASVVPSIGKVILKIDYTIDLDVDIFNYLNVKYQKNDKQFKISSDLIKDVTPDNYLENTKLLEVSKEIIENQKISFLFNVYGISFEYITG